MVSVEGIQMPVLWGGMPIESVALQYFAGESQRVGAMWGQFLCIIAVTTAIWLGLSLARLGGGFQHLWVKLVLGYFSYAIATVVVAIPFWLFVWQLPLSWYAAPTFVADLTAYLPGIAWGGVFWMRDSTRQPNGKPIGENVVRFGLAGIAAGTILTVIGGVATEMLSSETRVLPFSFVAMFVALTVIALVVGGTGWLVFRAFTDVPAGTFPLLGALSFLFAGLIFVFLVALPWLWFQIDIPDIPMRWDMLTASWLISGAPAIVAGLAWGLVFWLRTPKSEQVGQVA